MVNEKDIKEIKRFKLTKPQIRIKKELSIEIFFLYLQKKIELRLIKDYLYKSLLSKQETFQSKTY